MNRSIRNTIAAMALTILIIVSGCGMSGDKRVTIDGHTFRVPAGHLVKGRIPWLPASQSSGLTFITNPDAPLEAQRIVHIEPTEGRCNPNTPAASEQLSQACSAAKRRENRSLAQGSNLEKVTHDGDPTQWEYHLKSHSDGRSVVVVACYGPSAEAGLCTSLSNYKDLVYSVGVRDGDVQLLPEIWREIEGLLSSWEVSDG